MEKRIHFFSPFLKQNSRLLDVGCGTGRFIYSFSQSRGLKAHGCDSSIEMLTNAQGCNNIPIICCTSDRLSYIDNVFDMVISTAVFHHLSSEEVVFKTLREMVRVAKKGGKVVIWDANPLNPYWLFLFKRVPYDKDIKSLMPLRKILLEAKKLDLANIKVLKSGWIPDFAPKKLLFLFKFFEYIMERLPIINLFSAHNIIVFTK